MAVVVGLHQLNQKLDKLKDMDLQKTLMRACLVVESSAKEKCPSDTGLLRDSIISEVDGKEGRVGTNLYYAPYVHQGTGIYAVNGDGRTDVPWKYKDDEGNWHTTEGQQPQPFLADAYEENKDKIDQIIEDGIKEALKV
jgi:HK97 gp10 family phage protein